MTAYEVPSVLINTTVDEFKAEGFYCRQQAVESQVSDDFAQQTVTLKFIRNKQEENENG